ncbi:MAG: hypothetical protein M1820_010652 [Bogoriella megaspora]|nr:MAG: hypothetical protein M1820_010652 [Bogoriella megaspora]
MESKAHIILVVNVLFFVLTWFTASLRVYVRAILLKSFGRDDFLMILTLLSFTVYLVAQLGGLAHGTGRHMADLEPHQAMIALKFWFVCELAYILSSALLKIAIGSFLLRIAVARIHIWIIKIIMGASVLFGTFYWLLALLQCRPISDWWTTLKPLSGPHCISPETIVNATYAAGALNTLADWVLGTLPVFIVWNLSLCRRIKIIVIGILSFAAIGSTATIVRIPYTKGLANEDDFLWATSEIALWSTVEPGVGIAAGCLATLRPLIQRFLHRTGLSTGGSTLKLGGSPGPNNLHGYVRRSSRDFLDDIRPDINKKHQGTVTTITGQGQATSKGRPWRDKSNSSSSDDESRTDSQAHLPKGRIGKSVEVTYEELELMEGGGLSAINKV